MTCVLNTDKKYVKQHTLNTSLEYNCLSCFSISLSTIFVRKFLQKPMLKYLLYHSDEN